MTSELSLPPLPAYMPPIIFWCAIAAAVGAAGVLVCSCYQRCWWRAVFYGLVLAIHSVAATLWWPQVFGECAGKAGTTVPFVQGMTLCPGQSAFLGVGVSVKDTVPRGFKLR